MTGKTTTFERRLEVLFFIANRKQTSFMELAEYFSVSKCTIYRDVVFLSRYAPIFTKHGMYGGVFMTNGYKNNLTPHLTKAEKLLLEKISTTLTGSDARLLNNIINKFSMPNIPSGT